MAAVGKVKDNASLNFVFSDLKNQAAQTNARLLQTFINAAVTLMLQSLPKSSLAQRATPQLLVIN
jgi:hypothetical protein